MSRPRALWLKPLVIALWGFSSTCAAGTVEILRDRWGVPHIYGQTAFDTTFGLAYAQTQDDVTPILTYTMSARGRSAAIDGSRAAIESDTRVLAFRLPVICEKLYASQSQDTRDRCDGFAAGVEKFLTEHPDRKPAWFDHMSGRDVVAIGKWFQWQQELGEVSKDLSPPARRGGGDQADGIGGMSNMWAVGPSRSSRGETMLLSDPHLPWTGLTKWYESHQIIGDRWVYGAGFFGFAGIGIGFSQDIAWGSTNNGADTGDVYREKLNPENTDQYLYEGDWRPIEREIVAISLPGGRTVERAIRRTHHGPIMVEDLKNHVAYAARLAALDTVNLAESMHNYFVARSVDDVRALHDEGDDFKWNRIAVDRHGNIGYFYFSATHERDDQFNWGRPVDGSTAATEWGELLLGERLPSIVNPDGGLLVNCNNSPYTSAPGDNIRASAFPRHLAGNVETLAPTMRGHRATELLTALPKIDFADMERISMDIKTLTSAAYIDAIVDAYAKLGASGEPSADVERAIEILKSWDGMATAENQALPILACYVEAAGGAAASGGDAKRVAETFERALATMRSRWNTIEIAWGKVHVSRRGKGEWPLEGAGSELSVIPFTTLYMTGAKRFSDDAWVGDSGSSWMMLVKFDNGQVEAKTILPWGNSPDPASPHFGDQAPLYTKRTYKTPYLTRSEVEANVESRLVLETSR